MTFTEFLRKSLLNLAVAALFGLGTLPALAQDDNRPRLLTMLGIPSATVAPHGTTYLSFAYSTERRGLATGPDGSLSFGAGFGSAEDNVGVQVIGEITSLTDDPADSGYFDFRLSRRIASSPTLIYLGLGVNRLGAWGDAAGIDPSADLSLTMFPIIQTRNGPAPLMISLGAGTHVRDGWTQPGAYIGIGYGFSETFAASAAWYGDHATVGMSFSPKRQRNLNFTASLIDVFNQTPDQRLVFGVTVTFPKSF